MFSDNSCYANLPPQYAGQFVYLYEYDSYDITAWIDSNGNWTNNPTTGQPAYQLVYSRNWTGHPPNPQAQRSDPPNQLKYPKTMPPEKTVLTWCNYHVTTAGADRCPMVFASGTAKTINYKHLAESGWDIANAPYSR